MFSYILIAIAAASGSPAQITTHEFRNLEACEAAREFLMKNAPQEQKGLVWHEQYVNARCVLSQAKQ
ncbi:hypothetical protein [Massilia niastensis]|uniref:hypothetical protein n=1 Tax=Massilia niastensis TaxID=544911 RepID=UPI00035C9B52|nr:hypothetical protein [Massilia niastensis]